MNLTSCDNCGVVLDKDKLPFPDEIYDEEVGSIDTTLGIWNGNTFVAYVNCPICRNEILKDN